MIKSEKVMGDLPIYSQLVRSACDISQFSSVVQSCLTVFDLMDCNTPGFPVHHQFLELTQTHVHWVNDVILPFYPLSSPSPPAFNLSQHQGLFLMSQFFTSGVQSIWPSASVLPMNIQDRFPLGFDLFSVQGTLKSLLQHHSSKTSILRCSAFFSMWHSNPWTCSWHLK